MIHVYGWKLLTFKINSKFWTDKKIKYDKTTNKVNIYIEVVNILELFLES